MSGEVSSTSPVLGTRFATTSRQHRQILERYKRIAIVGLSANPYRPSHFVALYMRAAGYQIFPVNPREREIVGRKCYASLAEVPQERWTSKHRAIVTEVSMTRGISVDPGQSCAAPTNGRRARPMSILLKWAQSTCPCSPCRVRKRR